MSSIRAFETQNINHHRLDQLVLAKARSMMLKTIVTAVFFGLFLNLVQLGTPLYSMQIFDRVVPTGHLPTLIALTMLLLFITVCSLFIDASRGVLLARCSRSLADILGTSTPTIFDTQKPNGFDTADLDLLKYFVSGHAMIALLDLPWTGLYIGALFYIHPFIGVYTVVCLTVLLTISLVSRHILTSLEALSSDVQASLRKVEMSSHQQHFVNLATGRLPGIIRRLRKTRLDTDAIQAELKSRQAWIDAVTRSLRSAMQIGILAVATMLVVFQDVNAGAIVASSMIFTKAAAPIERLSSSFGTLKAVLNSWRRLNVSCKDPHCDPNSIPMPAIRGLLELESVSLYSSSRAGPVLSAITLTLRAGGLYVVVGSEASGKSALLKVLCGAERNHHGVVKLDGMAYRNYGSDQLSKEVGYLPQVIRLTPTTVFEFIGRDSGASEQDVFEAARYTGADPIIRQLSQGYQTQLKEDQCGVSHSQLRRIALASAIFGWPNLLVLDEPMLGMDAQGEHDVLELVRNLKSLGKTVVVVSESPKLVHLADELILLEQGRVKGVTDGSALRSRIGPRSVVTS